MSTPLDFAQTLKAQADIVRIVGDYVKLRKSGAQNFTGLCPFHNEKTPSFSVHATRQFYHCFGCGVSGDVFSFVQKIENISFPEAVRAVAQKLGVPLPRATFDSALEARDAQLRTRLMEMHERACNFFQEQLRRPEGARAREYLAGRGISEETISTFRVGFAPDSGFLLRDRFREHDEETLKASGLFSWKESSEAGPSTSSSLPAVGSDSAQDDNPKVDEHNEKKRAALYSKFRNRVMFPICNDAGRVIAFTGRTLATDEKSGPKYLNSPETAIYSKSRVLFNLDKAKEAIRKLDYAILVEGQMDCISVFMAGFHNVIASSGTAFTDLQARLLARFTRNIVVNFDPDTAGAAAAERSLSMLVQEEFQTKVLTLEPGFDPDLYIRKKGRDAYATALRHAQKYFDYLIERARASFPLRSPEGKVKAVNFLLPHIQRVPSRIVRDELAHEVAQKLGIDSAVLRQELRHSAVTRTSHQVKAAAEAQVTEAERILIRALATSGDLARFDDESAASHHRHHSSREGDETPFDPARQAQVALRNENLHQGVAAEALLQRLLDGEGADPLSLDLSDYDRKLLASTLMNEPEELTPELLEGAMQALRRRRLERRQLAVRTHIGEAERRQDSAALMRLMREKLEIDRELAGLDRPRATPEKVSQR